MFESLTKASVKDCIVEEGRIIFIVRKGEIAKAIGKKGANIRKVENLIKKKVKIIEFSEDLVEFVKNVVAPLKVLDVVDVEGIVTVTPVDSKIRGMLIGRSAVNLRGFEAIVQRYFPIKEMKVI